MKGHLDTFVLLAYRGTYMHSLIYMPLMQVDAASAPYFSTVTILGIVGFIAAVSIGSIAWYNSKRPVGWEDKERPDIVPEVEK